MSLSKKKVFLGSISFLIIYFFISKIEVKELFEVLGNLDWRYASLSLFLYLSTYLIRVWRIQVVFNMTDWLRCFKFIGIFQLINRTFPFRSGEVFFPILMKRMFHIDYSNAVFELVIIRFFDLLSLFIVFIITLLWFELLGKLYLALIILGPFILLRILFNKKIFFIDSIFSLFIKVFPSYSELAKKYKNYAENAIKKEKAKLYILFTLSIFDKVIGFSCFVIIVYGLGFSIELGKVLAAIGLSGFTEILPINSLGNFGTLELGWVGALVQQGVNYETAIKSGFASHLVSYFFTLVIGLLCFISFLFIPTTKKTYINNCF